MKLLNISSELMKKCAFGIILNIDQSFTYTNENVFLMLTYLPPLEPPFYSDIRGKGHLVQQYT